MSPANRGERTAPVSDVLKRRGRLGARTPPPDRQGNFHYRWRPGETGDKAVERSGVPWRRTRPDLRGQSWVTAWRDTR